MELSKEWHEQAEKEERLPLLRVNSPKYFGIKGMADASYLQGAQAYADSVERLLKEQLKELELLSKEAEIDYPYSYDLINAKTDIINKVLTDLQNLKP